MRYELSHDSIARQIFEKQSEDMRLRRKVKKEIFDKFEAFQARGVHLTKDDISYFKPQLAAIHLSNEEEAFLREEEARLKRQTRNFRLIVLGIILLLSGFLGVTLLQWNKANHQTQKLTEEKALTEQQKRDLEEQEAKLAESLEDVQGLLKIARNAENKALQEKLEADSARIFAQQQELRALRLKDEADVARIYAQLSADTARMARDEALREKRSADTARNKALVAERSALRSAQEARFNEESARALEVYPKNPTIALNLAYNAYEGMNSPSLKRAYMEILYARKGLFYQNFKGHTDEVWSAKFSFNSKFIISSSRNGKILIHDLTGKEVVSYRHGNRDMQIGVFEIAVSPKNYQILSGGADNRVNLWLPDESTWTMREFSGPKGDIGGLAFSSGGDSMAIGSFDNTIRIWDLRTMQMVKLLKGHEKPVVSLAFSPDNKYLLSGTKGNIARLWPLEGGRKRVIEFGDNLCSVAFSPTGDTLLLGGGKIIQLWNLKGGVIKTITSQAPLISALAFAPDGRTILSGHIDNMARLWNLNGKEIKTFAGHKGSIYSVAFSHDGKSILTAGEDKTVKLWRELSTEVESYRRKGKFKHIQIVHLPPSSDPEVQSLNKWKVKRFQEKKGFIELPNTNNEYYALAMHPDQVYSPDAIYGAAVYKNPTIGFMTLGRGTGLWVIKDENKFHRSSVTAMAYLIGVAPTWISADVGGNVIFHTHKGRKVAAVKTPFGRINALAVSPDGKYLATGGKNQSAYLWSIEEMLKGVPADSLKPKASFSHKGDIAAITFSPDGEKLLTGSGDNTAALWSLTGEKLQTFRGQFSSVLAVAMSNNGQYVLTGLENRTAVLWNMEGTVIQTFQGHTDQVWGVAFSPDDAYAITTSLDKTMRLWGIAGTGEGVGQWPESIYRYSDEELKELGFGSRE